MHDLLDVFTPARPKISGRALTGRHTELNRIVAALTAERCHVVLYSKRGRGKTSLANAAVEVLRSRGVAVARYTCHSGSSFQEIVNGLLRDLPGSLLVVSAEQRSGTGCEAALPKDGLCLADLVLLPSRLTCRSLVCVVDEFDRVEDAIVRSQFADAIKHLSDRGSQLVFLLIGVAENLDNLLGQHESIRRNVVPVALPLLTRDEVRTMVATGATQAGFDIEGAVLDDVAALSGGVPYVAQSVALRMIQATAGRGGVLASGADLCHAAVRLVDEASPGMGERYTVLTSHGHDRLMVRCLHTIATAEQDQYGRLCASPDQDMVKLNNSPVPLACWQRALAAGVIVPGGMAQGGVSGEDKVVIADRELLTYGMLLGLAQQSQPAGPPEAAMRVPSLFPGQSLIKLAEAR